MSQAKNQREAGIKQRGGIKFGLGDVLSLKYF
jgi:hypothetical protein